MSTGSALVILLIVGCLYFLPCLVAGMRGVRKQSGIFIVNLAFGWTLVGWLVALVWAIQAQTDEEYDEKLDAGLVNEERIARAVAAALEAERQKSRT